MAPDIRDIFESHHLRVYRYLLRLSASRSAAEDLTQEVFLRALRALRRYRPEGRTEAWLLRIARNLWIDRGRAKARRPRLVEARSEELSSTATQALRHGLDDALGNLPAAEREAFLLREVGGLSYVEIAELSAASVAAVRSRIYRARQALRAALRPEPTDLAPIKMESSP